MREYGQIQCAFWINPEMQRMEDGPKLLATYLLTGPHSNGLGCYPLPFGYVQADLGYGFDTVSKGFQTLVEKGFVRRCDATGYIFIPKYLRWNTISNPKVASARQKEFEAIPSSFSYFQELAIDMLAYGKHFDAEFRKGIETVSKRSPNGSKSAIGNGFEIRTDPNPPDPAFSMKGSEGEIDPETGEIF